MHMHKDDAWKKRVRVMSEWKGGRGERVGERPRRPCVVCFGLKVRYLHSYEGGTYRRTNEVSVFLVVLPSKVHPVGSVRMENLGLEN